MSNSNLYDLDGMDASDDEKNIRDSHIGLASTSTNMFVGMLANSDKMISSEKRWNFGDDKDEYERDKEQEHEHYKPLERDRNKERERDNERDNEIDNEREKERDNEREKERENERDKHSVVEDNELDDEPRNYIRKEHHSNSPKTSRRNETPSETEDTSAHKDGDYDDIVFIKLDMLRKLGELKQYGVTLSQNYNLDSNLKSMECEYKLHSDIRAKQNGVKWMSHMLVGILKGVEFLNDSYNPFEIKLTGLGDSVKDDIQSYYDIIGEIYEKWNQPGSRMAPELRLLLLIGSSAATLQLNKAIGPMMSSMLNRNNSNNNAEGELAILKKKASANSDKHRDATQEMADKEHAQALQKMSDMQMMKLKAMEYAKMQKDAQNIHLEKDLKLTTESPGFFGSDDNDSQYKLDDDIKKMQIEVLAKKQKIRDAKTSINAKAKMNFLKEESKRLDGLLDSFSEIDTNYDEKERGDNVTESSTESKISINPDIEKLMNNKNKKSAMRKKRMNTVKDKITMDSITLGSTEKKKKPNNITLNS